MLIICAIEFLSVDIHYFSFYLEFITLTNASSLQIVVTIFILQPAINVRK